MIRRFLPLLFLGAATCLGAQLGRLQFEADDVTGNSERMEARGNVRLRDPGLAVTADAGVYDLKNEEVTLTGHVVLTRESIRVLADKLTYRRPDQSFTAENVRLGSAPYYAEGASATGTGNEVTVHKARISYGEPGPWQPTLTAESVTFAPGRRLRSEGAFLGIGHGQLLPFPHFEQNLAAPFVGYATLNGGYRSSLGVFVEAGLHVPVALGVRLGGDIGLYSNRGVLVGPSGSYLSGDNGESWRGFFRSGYINDHGDKKTDILDRPVPEDRAFVEWQHQQKLADNLTLAAHLNWWRDSEVLRDFRPREFFRVQEPDTFVESVYTGENYFISAFGRFQPNTYHRVQERLPEIRFDLLPVAVGNGFLTQGAASFVRLRERGPFTYGIGLTGGPVTTFVQPNRTLQQTDRLDGYLGITRPFAPTDWFTFTPVAGGRVTHYSNTRVDPLFAAFNPDLYPLRGLSAPPGGAVIAIAVPSVPPNGGITRRLGEVGFDAVLRSAGTFAYQNEFWKIDGLRHLFTPRVAYRYIEGAGARVVPKIDRPAFSTYLQPLGLADDRAIDTQTDANVLRLAFDNVLQTRDARTGTRDLASFTVANDFGFGPKHGDLSGLQLEAALMPAPWLQFDAYQRYTARDISLREFNTGVTLHDGNMWSLRFGNNFLRRQLNDYAIDGRFRLNESYELLTRLNYDVRKRRFNEQAYGVAQNLGNTWLISYVVTLYSGPRRESHFGLRVQIDTVRF